MKKALSILLALALLVSLAPLALAEADNTDTLEDTDAVEVVEEAALAEDELEELAPAPDEEPAVVVLDFLMLSETPNDDPPDNSVITEFALGISQPVFGQSGIADCGFEGPTSEEAARKMEIAEARWVNRGDGTVISSNNPDGPAATAGIYDLTVELRAKDGFSFADSVTLGRGPFEPLVLNVENGMMKVLEDGVIEISGFNTVEVIDPDSPEARIIKSISVNVANAVAELAVRGVFQFEFAGPDSEKMAAQMEITEERWVNRDDGTVISTRDAGAAIPTPGTYDLTMVFTAKEGYTFADTISLSKDGPGSEEISDGRGMALLDEGRTVEIYGVRTLEVEGPDDPPDDSLITGFTVDIPQPVFGQSGISECSVGWLPTDPTSQGVEQKMEIVEARWVNHVDGTVISSNNPDGPAATAGIYDLTVELRAKDGFSFADSVILGRGPFEALVLSVENGMVSQDHMSVLITGLDTAEIIDPDSPEARIIKAISVNVANASTGAELAVKAVPQFEFSGPDSEKMAAQMEITEERWVNRDDGTVISTRDAGAAIPTPGTYDLTMVFTAKEGYTFADTISLSKDGPGSEEISDGRGMTLSDDARSVELYNVRTLTVGDYLPGDANGDKTVDGRDLIRMKRNLAGYTDAVIDLANADVTGDEIFDGRDVIRLARYLAGYQVTLG